MKNNTGTLQEIPEEYREEFENLLAARDNEGIAMRLSTVTGKKINAVVSEVKDPSP